MEGHLTSISSLGQKDKAPAYSTLLRDTLSTPGSATVAADLHAFVDAVVNQDNLLVGRQILTEVVKFLADGAIADSDLKKAVVQDIVSIVLPKIVSYEEQVSKPPWIRNGALLLSGYRTQVAAGRYI